MTQGEYTPEQNPNFQPGWDFVGVCEYFNAQDRAKLTYYGPFSDESIDYIEIHDAETGQWLLNCDAQSDAQGRFSTPAEAKQNWLEGVMRSITSWVVGNRPTLNYAPTYAMGVRA